MGILCAYEHMQLPGIKKHRMKSQGEVTADEHKILIKLIVQLFINRKKWKQSKAHTEAEIANVVSALEATKNWFTPLIVHETRNIHAAANDITPGVALLRRPVVSNPGPGLWRYTSASVLSKQWEILHRKLKNRFCKHINYIFKRNDTQHFGCFISNHNSSIRKRKRAILYFKLPDITRIKWWNQQQYATVSGELSISSFDNHVIVCDAFDETCFYPTFSDQI